MFSLFSIIYYNEWAFYIQHQNKKEKIKDYIIDYDDLEDKFISTFGLEKEVKSQLKLYLNGKEIIKNDDLMDILKPDNIIEVLNINEV